MRRNLAVLFVLALSIIFLSCFEDDDNPVSPKDEDAPEAEILSPANGEIFPLGSTITFIGTGVDPQDGILDDASLVWRADQKDTLGTGDSIATNALAEGSHTIVLTAEDSDGKTGSDRVIISVIRENLSLESIWPNSDGDSWRFQYACRWWDDASDVPCWPTPEEVPDLPTMEEFEDLLRNQPTGDVCSTEEGEYALEFAGDTTTRSGATAQNLRETLTLDQGALALAAPSKAGAALLTRLCIARPDVAEKIRSKYPSIEVDAYPPQGKMSGLEISSESYAAIFMDPILVHGYAWEKTRDWIGTYGDIDQALAWKFLESDLGTGHEFSFQLVPSLADDVYLHCKVLRTFTAHTRLGSFEDSIECLYVIDYGIHATMPGVVGEAAEYTRTFDYGSVIYSPGIGPVYSYERALLYPGEQPSLGIGDMEISLLEAILR